MLIFWYFFHSESFPAQCALTLCGQALRLLMGICWHWCHGVSGSASATPTRKASGEAAHNLLQKV